MRFAGQSLVASSYPCVLAVVCVANAGGRSTCKLPQQDFILEPAVVLLQDNTLKVLEQHKVLVLAQNSAQLNTELLTSSAIMVTLHDAEGIRCKCVHLNVGTNRCNRG